MIILEEFSIFIYEQPHEENPLFAYAKTKVLISCAVTEQLIRAFFFVT